MWEERSCGQVRQWQHWGSGCYEFTCEAGRLHIIILNQASFSQFIAQRGNDKISWRLLFLRCFQHDNNNNNFLKYECY